MNAVLHGFDGRNEGRIEISAALLEGNTLSLEVSDNGGGMPDEVLSKIFDPFFTTRLGQGGSGLGLTICHTIVTTLLGGRIAVHSVMGQGTRFTLTLPLTAPDHPEPSQPDTASARAAS